MPKGQVNFSDWACRSCKKGNLQQIIDPNLEGQIAPECLNKFAEAAYNCLKDQGVQRPSMNDVVWNLEFILKLQDAADNRGQKMELNGYPTSPYFPLIMNDHTNISTDEGFEAFAGSHEVGGKYTSSATSMTSNSDDKLKSDTIFSEILNPSGR
ncbi:receptor-like protein kinase FERONIA [Solanum stenotomum]|uniref:receptor-like protein kinase FERONIA n=1 Tax=Solanum stenotomum TaxID=172797 RepID=UPI0020D07332|nr:receptor-like protein kinase FERONIA [Solanum stenotomum]